MRRSKATLFLFELVIIILIFAICCAICLSLFTASRRISIEAQDLSSAIIEAQSVAESLKSCKGDLDILPNLLNCSKDDTSIAVYYDANWRPIENSDSAIYKIEVSTETNASLLYAHVVVYKQGESIYELPVTQYLG